MKKTARQKCLEAFQRLRRIEEADENGWVTCISCGKEYFWKDVDGGHFIQRDNRATELEGDNVWPQCKHCNRYKSGNYANYRLGLIDRIGEDRVARLEKIHGVSQGANRYLLQLSREDQLLSVSRRNTVEYEELARQFRSDARKLMKEKGL
jgi:hypothetical protein